MNSANTPAFIAGALATLTLLASGVFAVASYVAFLSPIAALVTSIHITLILFVLSTSVIAFSYKIIKIISQNKKLDEASKQTNGAATKDEVEKLKEELKTVLDETSKQINGAATKDEIEALNKSLATQLDKVSKQANSAATKDEIEALNEGLTTQLGEISKQTSSAATKEELKKLSDGIKKLGEELGSAAKDEKS